MNPNFFIYIENIRNSSANSPSFSFHFCFFPSFFFKPKDTNFTSNITESSNSERGSLPYCITGYDVNDSTKFVPK